MEPDLFERRERAAEQAASLYGLDPQTFTWAAWADATGEAEADLKLLFSTKTAALRWFYTALPERIGRRLELIPEFGTFTLAERYAQYVYTALDLLDSQREFVEKTYRRYVIETSGTHAFASGSAAFFRKTAGSDTRIPDINRPFMPDFVFDLMGHAMLRLVAFWLEDESDGSGQTLAWVDKTTALFQEAAYSGVADRAVDLLKFIYQFLRR